MKKIRVIAVICAVVVALAAFVGMQVWEKQKQNTVNVVVLTENVPQNTILQADMMEIKAVPEELAVAEAGTAVEPLVGKMAKVDLKAGEQLPLSRVTDVGQRTATSLAVLVEKNMRAITIAVDEVSGMYNMIYPGDRVDVLCHYTNVYDEEVSAVLVQNVQVLAVDNVLSTAGKSDYTTVTLMVTPQQANKIHWNENEGSLRLILRTPLDTAASGAVPVTAATASN